MGYTHYFEHHAVLDKTWKKITDDCTKLFKALPENTDSAGGYHKDDNLQLSYWDKKKEDYIGPCTKIGQIISDEEIAFNGYPNDLGHESCILEKGGSNGFQFCKTARKPYDLMVCACLIVYYYHSPETIDLASGGLAEDWKPATDFVTEVLGPHYLMKIKMMDNKPDFL